MGVEIEIVENSTKKSLCGGQFYLTGNHYYIFRDLNVAPQQLYGKPLHVIIERYRQALKTLENDPDANLDSCNDLENGLQKNSFFDIYDKYQNEEIYKPTKKNVYIIINNIILKLEDFIPDHKMIYHNPEMIRELDFNSEFDDSEDFIKVDPEKVFLTLKLHPDY